MRRSLIVVLLACFVACDSSTGPGADFIGSYSLVLEESDTALAIVQMPDGGSRYSVGFMTIENAGAFSYALLTQICYINGCTSPVVYESKGTWTAQGADVTLKDSDGSSELWHYSKLKISGVSGHLFKPGIKLVFERCENTQSEGCKPIHYLGA